MSDTKKCPYCGGEIKAVAKKCKHCGEWLADNPTNQMVNVIEINSPEQLDHEDESAKAIIEKDKSCANIQCEQKEQLIWGLIGIVVIVGMVCAILFITRANNTNSSTDDVAEYAMVEVEEMPEEIMEEPVPVHESKSSLSDEESIKKFIKNMYAEVLPAVEREQGDRYIKKYFTDDFTDFYSMTQKYDAKYNAGEVGFFDCEFWTRSQDPDADIKPTIQSVIFDKDYMDNVFADVKVSLKGKYNPATNVNIRLFKTGDSMGWVIGDYAGILSSMKTYLATQPQ